MAMATAIMILQASLEPCLEIAMVTAMTILPANRASLDLAAATEEETTVITTATIATAPKASRA